MSAWIVSKAHIDVLVRELGVRELFPDGMSPDEVGALLWEENHKSVNYRYNENTPTPAYRYTVPPTRWTPDQVLRHIGCWDYQTCEHSTYEDSEAFRLVSQLRDVLQGAGADSEKAPSDTPWGVPDCGGLHASYEECAECAALYEAAK